MFFYELLNLGFFSGGVGGGGVWWGKYIQFFIISISFFTLLRMEKINVLVFRVNFIYKFEKTDVSALKLLSRTKIIDTN